MSLFKKNPNEAAFAGGKKHFLDVIKNSGDGNLLIYKCPEEDFNTGSTLIVQEGEEAIFLKDGAVQNVFTAGRHVLSTDNYPFLSRIVNAFSGGISTFNCKVYFIRTASSMEILWGTASPIQVRDPIQMIMTSLRARGSFKISVCNGQVFLSKLIGNNVDFLTQEGITLFFRNEMMTHVKSQIAKYIKETNEEILGICSEQEELSQKITPALGVIFEEYGVKLLNFSISAIDIPENDPNRQKLEAAYSTKRESQIYGNEYQKFVAREVVTNLSKNDNAAGIAVMGAGMNAAGGVGNMFASAGGELFNSAPNPASAATSQNTVSGVKCAKCNAINNSGAKFCSECGSPLEAKKSFCTNCGAELAPGVKFCSGCGTKVGE